VNYIIEGRKYSLRRDDLILISNQELHRPDIASGAVYERIVLWVNPDFLRSLGTAESNLLACFERTPKSRPNLIRPGGAALAGIKSLMHRLNQIAAAPTGRFGEDVLRQTCLAELLVLINQAFLEEAPDNLDEDIASDPTINEIIRYINQNLAGVLSLDVLAERFYISKYHLARQFKKHAGFTLYSFILHKRLILAKALLAEDRQLHPRLQEGLSYNPKTLRPAAGMTSFHRTSHAKSEDRDPHSFITNSAAGCLY
jgi:AraC-like DNA-binding protein